MLLSHQLNYHKAHDIGDSANIASVSPEQVGENFTSEQQVQKLDGVRVYKRFLEEV